MRRDVLGWLAALAAAAGAACVPNVVGTIPCTDDFGCPSGQHCDAQKCVGGERGPVLNVIEPENGAAAVGALKIKVEAKDPDTVAKVEASAGDAKTTLTAGSDGSTFEGALNTTTLEDGAYILEITATDGSPAAQTASAFRSIRVDNTDPAFDPVIVQPEIAKRGSTLQIVAVASEPLDGAPSVTVGGANATLDPDESTGLVYTFSYTVPSSGGTAGAKDILVTGRDLLGNEAQTTAHVTFDFTAPTVSNVVIAPARARPGASVEISFHTSEQAAASEVMVDGDPATPIVPTGTNLEFVYTVSASDANGDNDVDITVEDAAGNEGTASAKLFVDKLPPDLEDLVVTPLALKSGDTLHVTFTPPADLASAEVKLHALLDYVFQGSAGSYTLVTSAGSGGVPEGGARVEVTTTDAAGNVAVNNTSVTFDNSAPYVYIQVLPVVGPGQTQTIEAFLTEAVDALPARVNGVPLTMQRAGVTYWTATYSTTTGGTYDVDATATDRAGNIGNYRATFVVDATAPEVLNLAATPPAAAQNATVDVTFSLTETPATLGVQLDTGALTKISGAGTGPYLFRRTLTSSDTAGMREIQVDATDAAGNAGSATLDYILDFTAPTLSASQCVYLRNPSGATSFVIGGQATEANAIVEVRSGSTTIGTARADAQGSFLVTLTGQRPPGVALVVKDAAGNASAPTPPSRTEEVITFAGKTSGDNSVVNASAYRVLGADPPLAPSKLFALTSSDNEKPFEYINLSYQNIATDDGVVATSNPPASITANAWDAPARLTVTGRPVQFETPLVTGAGGTSAFWNAALNRLMAVRTLYASSSLFVVEPDVFVHDGTAFRAWPTAGAPIAVDAAFAPDGQGRVMLFGGHDPSVSPAVYRNQTYANDGTGWSQVFDTSPPSARYGALMVFDAQRNKHVLFGGIAGGPFLSDTWERTGTTWSQLSTGTVTLYSTTRLVYDATTGTVLLVTGDNTNIRTYALASGTWQLRSSSPAAGANPRLNFAVAWDGNLGRVVLFGGYRSVTSPLVYPNDLWSFNTATSTWEIVTTQNPPFGRSWPALAWDGRSGRLMLMGGSGETESLKGETWSFGGSRWALESSDLVIPSALNGSAQNGVRWAWDPERGRAFFANATCCTLPAMYVFEGFQPAIFGGFDLNSWSTSRVAWDEARERIVVMSQNQYPYIGELTPGSGIQSRGTASGGPTSALDLDPTPVFSKGGGVGVVPRSTSRVWRYDPSANVWLLTQTGSFNTGSPFHVAGSPLLDNIYSADGCCQSIRLLRRATLTSNSGWTLWPAGSPNTNFDEVQSLALDEARNVAVVAMTTGTTPMATTGIREAAVVSGVNTWRTPSWSLARGKWAFFPDRHRPGLFAFNLDAIPYGPLRVVRHGVYLRMLLGFDLGAHTAGRTLDTAELSIDGTGIGFDAVGQVNGYDVQVWDQSLRLWTEVARAFNGRASASLRPVAEMLDGNMLWVMVSTRAPTLVNTQPGALSPDYVELRVSSNAAAP